MKITKISNGNGSITKLKGNRRNPYLVRTNTSFQIVDGKLKEQRKVIGYARTKEEAFQLLNQYMQCPYDLNKSKITFKELYKQWMPSYFEGISKSTQSNYKVAYSHCYMLYDRVFKDLKLADYQYMFDNVTDTKGRLLSQDNLKRIKVFLGLLNNYAIANEIIVKDNSKFVDLKRYKNRECKKIDREIFEEIEISKLWMHKDNPSAKLVLFLIYTGLRIGECLNIKKEDINITEHYLSVTKSKTNSGIRKVPIADCIFPFVEDAYYNDRSKYLFHTKFGYKYDVSYFRKEVWKPFMEEMKMDHKPHDTRHTFNSLLADLDVNEDTREILMGHSSNKVNVSVYTHLQNSKLLSIVNRIA